MHNLLIDIGNSSINYAAHNTNTNRIELLQDLESQDLTKYTFQKILISSVAPQKSEELEKYLTKSLNLSPSFITINDLEEINWSKHYKNPTEIGADIGCGLYHCYKAFTEENIITIDTGTATTIAALNCNAEFLGGVIIPGFDLQIKSLSQNTEQLKNQIFSEPSSILGDTTENAINSGVFFGHIGSVQYFISQIQHSYFKGENVRIVISGGAGYKLSHYFDNAIYIPNIVLEGLKWIV